MISGQIVVHDGFESRTSTCEQVAGGMPYILSGLKTLLETGKAMGMPAMTAAAS